jgi:hypothetical protein
MITLNFVSAGTCALEQVGLAAWRRILTGYALDGEASSTAATQASWIIGRLEYISKHLGLRWAVGLAATLNGDFQRHHDIPIEYTHTMECVEHTKCISLTRLYRGPPSPTPDVNISPLFCLPLASFVTQLTVTNLALAKKVARI